MLCGVGKDFQGDHTGESPYRQGENIHKESASRRNMPGARLLE